MRAGRNDPCPCGSGKKFKACCDGKSARGLSGGLLTLVGVIAVIAALGIYTVVTGEGTKPQARAAAPANSPAAQPPGPAPAGKVWSVEHGHWHDAAQGGGAAPATMPATAPASRAPQPQPPGTPPAGKVWSPEHGHWHDAPK